MEQKQATQLVSSGMVADLEPFRKSVVRLLDRQGRYWGLGLRVSASEILSCAHVVAQALRHDPTAIEPPSGSVDVMAAVHGSGLASLGQASVLQGGWYPKDNATSTGAMDLCVLKLAESQPQPFNPASISGAISLTGLRCALLGAPSAHRDDLVPITGRMGEAKAGGRYLLLQDPGFIIEPGCSGAPVCDKATGQVVGMVVQDEQDESLRVAFVIPAAEMIAALHHANVATQIRAPDRLYAVRHWVDQGVGRLEPALGNQLKQYVDAYSGTPAHPLPFAGRDAEMARLLDWLPGGGVFCVLGGAGRGKSSLLLNYVAKVLVEQPSAVTLLFLPISIRFNTSDELRGLRLLYLQMGALFAELRFNDDVALDQDDYRERIARGWEFVANQSARRFLLVIDGSDEASGAWIEHGLLPYQLPVNLSVIVSTRTPPGQHCAPEWLLNLRGADGEVRYCTNALAPLSAAAVYDAVVQLGIPISTSIATNLVMEELYRLTDQGDPLLVTLWVTQLCQSRGSLQAFTLEKMQPLAPGIEGFLGLWFLEQQKIWDRDGKKISRKLFEPILEIFAMAAGPLTPRDVRALAHLLQLADVFGTGLLEELLQSATRLLVNNGDDGGLAFVHPRLGYHYRALLEQQPTRLEKFSKGFIAWGRQTINALNLNELASCDCPVYLLHHFVQHVRDADLPPETALNDFLMPMIDGDGWHRAWFEEEGSYSGFLGDISRVEDVLQGARASYFPVLVHCWLCRASIRSFIGSIPPELIAELVKANVWSAKRAIRNVAQLVDPRRQIDALVGIVMVTGNGHAQMMERALDIALSMALKQERAEALAQIAPFLADQTLLERTMQAIEALPAGAGRSKAVTALGAQLSGRPLLLDAALQCALEEPDQELRMMMLSAASQVCARESGQLLQYLQAILSLTPERHLLPALTAIAPRLQATPALLDVVLDSFEARSHERQGWALSALAPQLMSCAAMHERSLKFLRCLRDRNTQRELLLAFCVSLADADGGHAQLLLALNSVDDPVSRAWAMMTVGTREHLAISNDTLREAIDILALDSNKTPMMRGLGKVLPHCMHRAALLEHVLALLPTLTEPEWRAELLRIIIAGADGRGWLLLWASDLVLDLDEGYARDELLCTLSKSLSLLTHLREHSAYLIDNIQDSLLRIESTAALCALFDGVKRTTKLRRAIAEANNFTHSRPRAEALRSLATAVAQAPDVQAEWMSAVALVDEEARVELLCDFGASCEGGAGAEALKQALDLLDSGSFDELFCSPARLRIARSSGRHGDVLERLLNLTSYMTDTAVCCSIAHHLPRHTGLTTALITKAGKTGGDVVKAIATAVNSEPRVMRLILDAAQLIGDDDHRIEAFAVLFSSAKTSPATMIALLKVAVGIDTPSCRWRTLAKAVPFLDGESQRETLIQAFELAIEMKVEPALMEQNLKYLLQYMSIEKTLFRRTLEFITQVEDDALRGRLLVTLAEAPDAEPDILRRTLDAIGLIRLEVYRIGAINAVRPHILPHPGLHRSLISLSESVSDRNARASILLSVATHLDAGSPAWDTLLDLAVALPRSAARDLVLRSLIEHFCKKPQTLRRAFGLAGRMRRDTSRATVVTTWFGNAIHDIEWSSPILQEFFTIICRIKHRRKRRDLFEGLALRLPQMYTHALPLLQAYLRAPADPARRSDLIANACLNLAGRDIDCSVSAIKFFKRAEERAGLRAGLMAFFWRLAQPPYIRGHEIGEPSISLNELADNPTLLRSIRRCTCEVHAPDSFRFWMEAAERLPGRTREWALRQALDASNGFHFSSDGIAELGRIQSLTRSRTRILAYALKSISLMPYDMRQKSVEYVATELIMCGMPLQAALNMTISGMSSNLIPPFLNALIHHGCRDKASVALALDFTIAQFGRREWYLPEALVTSLQAYPDAQHRLLHAIGTAQLYTWDREKSLTYFSMHCGADLALWRKLLQLAGSGTEHSPIAAVLHRAIEVLPADSPLIGDVFQTALLLEGADERFGALLLLISRLSGRLQDTALNAALDDALQIYGQQRLHAKLETLLSCCHGNTQGLKKMCHALMPLMLADEQLRRRLFAGFGEAINSLSDSDMRYGLIRQLVRTSNGEDRVTVLHAMLPSLMPSVKRLGGTPALEHVAISIVKTARWWP